MSINMKAATKMIGAFAIGLTSCTHVDEQQMGPSYSAPYSHATYKIMQNADGRQIVTDIYTRNDASGMTMDFSKHAKEGSVPVHVTSEAQGILHTLDSLASAYPHLNAITLMQTHHGNITVQKAEGAAIPVFSAQRNSGGAVVGLFINDAASVTLECSNCEFRPGATIPTLNTTGLNIH
jgi:hypothetical protein